ncbi:uncharacterized protein BYT42DRAFT_565691 [Radiomyces spectabilis]|uniref:uncharacterized protein n=1 Tax=Radiomyces spectabilis TaxID=64574 RepID=UPI0022200EA2|nr:uncharacterized protein BYT42DRAFT_565691 [Radiomyces spectabilis]KAI8381212.1 hypothetical protein BYT42DRAFT_565691 [Radiomyces spectabilis]
MLLRHLSLESWIPLFQKHKLDLTDFLAMTDPADFENIGVKEPHVCRRLSLCARSMQARVHHHRQYTAQKSKSLPPSTSTLKSYHDPFPPHSALPNTEVVRIDDELFTHAEDEDEACILRAVNALDSYLLSLRQTSSCDPTTPLTCLSPPSYISSMYQTCDRVSLPDTMSTPTPLLSRSQHVKTQRPTSLPAYLEYPTSDPGDDIISPPEYPELERCNSLMQTCEQVNSEEKLPAYECTVYKMGHVSIKREMDAPGVQSRWRYWRGLYVALWGTVLRIYKTEPSEAHCKYRYHPRIPFLSKVRQENAPLMTLSLAGADARKALDYNRRPHTLRLTTANGPQLLLHLHSYIEMISWIEHLQAAINISSDLEHRPMPRFMTLLLPGHSDPLVAQQMLMFEYLREQRLRQQEETLI